MLDRKADYMVVGGGGRTRRPLAPGGPGGEAPGGRAPGWRLTA